MLSLITDSLLMSEEACLPNNVEPSMAEKKIFFVAVKTFTARNGSLILNDYNAFLLSHDRHLPGIEKGEYVVNSGASCSFYWHRLHMIINCSALHVRLLYIRGEIRLYRTAPNCFCQQLFDRHFRVCAFWK